MEPRSATIDQKYPEISEENTVETTILTPLAVGYRKAAQLTDVSKASLRRAARDGRLRTVRIGSRVVIPFDALKAFIAAGQSAAERMACE
jgi:excisionase family DNA binding protein